jgi:hypothetical protein
VRRAFIHVDDEGRDLPMPQKSASFHASLTANQRIGLTSWAVWRPADGDWALKANLLDAPNDSLVGTIVAGAWVRDCDIVDFQHLNLR